MKCSLKPNSIFLQGFGKTWNDEEQENWPCRRPTPPAPQSSREAGPWRTETLSNSLYILRLWSRCCPRCLGHSHETGRLAGGHSHPHFGIHYLHVARGRGVSNDNIDIRVACSKHTFWLRIVSLNENYHCMVPFRTICTNTFFVITFEKKRVRRYISHGSDLYDKANI